MAIDDLGLITLARCHYRKRRLLGWFTSPPDALESDTEVRGHPWGKSEREPSSGPIRTADRKMENPRCRRHHDRARRPLTFTYLGRPAALNINAMSKRRAGDRPSARPAPVDAGNAVALVARYNKNCTHRRSANSTLVAEPSPIVPSNRSTERHNRFDNAALGDIQNSA